MERAITQWLQVNAANAKKGDWIIVVLIAHGVGDGRILLSFPQKHRITEPPWGWTGTYPAVSGTRLLLVNEACHAGDWTALHIILRMGGYKGEEHDIQIFDQHIRKVMSRANPGVEMEKVPAHDMVAFITVGESKFEPWC